MRRLVVLAALAAAALTAAPPANAAFFPGESIHGPSADIQRVSETVRMLLRQHRR